MASLFRRKRCRGMKNFVNWLKGVIKMFVKGDDIKKAIGAEVAVSNEMQEAIDLWQRMFQNKAPWLDENTQSLGLAGAVASEIARLVTVEFHSEVTGSKRAEFLQENYAFVLSKLREQTEFAAATGGLVFKPYMDNGRIAIDFVHAERFIPTAYNSRGEITGAVFVERVKKGRAWYTRLERHELTDRGYSIQNKAFMTYTESELGVPANLTSVDEWAALEEDINLHYADGSTLEKPLFVYFKMPFANQVDADAPLGVSVYSRAVDLMRQADLQYSRILWEYEGSELAIDADVIAMQGTKLPVRKQRLFRSLNVQKRDGGDLYEVFSPAIRDNSLFNGLNQLLRRIEFNCNLSYGTLSDPQNEAKTAEEIKMSRQRSYSAVCEIQKALEDALRHLVWVLDYYTSLYGLAPTGEYETTFTWGDGVLTDTGVEYTQLKALVDSGILKPEKLVSWYFGISEEEAKDYMPKQQGGIGFEE